MFGMVQYEDFDFNGSVVRFSFNVLLHCITIYVTRFTNFITGIQHVVVRSHYLAVQETVKSMK